MINNEQSIEDIKHLKQFINLYNQCKDVDKLTKVNNEESRLFSLKSKGDKIRFGNTRKLLDYIPQREGLYKFFQENKYFWIIPMEIKPGEVFGYTLRGYSDKQYTVFRLSNIPSVLFGLYDFENFKYQKDTIILTEGIKDCLLIKTFYPYTIALSTAGLTTNSWAFIKSLTNKFILIYDNDKAGKEATIRDLKLFKENKIKGHSINLRYKDISKYYGHETDLKILNSNIKQYI